MTMLFRFVAVVSCLLFLSAVRGVGQYRISPLLPPIPSLDGPLEINLVYPTAGMTKPGVNRNFIFGSVGTGNALLTINGDTVPVAPNGAFLAFLPMPRNGIYALLAERGEERDTLVFTYAEPQAGTSVPRQVLDLKETPKLGVVTQGADTLATGSDIAYGAPEPTASSQRQWNFPRGTQFPVYERRGDYLRIDLAGETAWVEEKYVTVSSDGPQEMEAGTELVLEEADRWADVIIPVRYTPFRLESQLGEIELTFYNALAFELEKRLEEKGEKSYAVSNPPNSVVAGYRWRVDTGRAVLNLTIDLRRPLRGFKAFYDQDGRLVLRLRRPKALDREKPLRGLRIMVDAGHPPRGADGPTGLTEAEANLAIALRLEQKLKDAGASVIMTRRDGAAIASESDPTVELTARVAMAVEKNADLLISVHNNGFSDGVNPFERNGTETYYFNPFAADLARLLHEEIVAVTGVPSLGFKQRSLALTRPTWMPAVLTESLYMMHPQQEAALRDPEFLDRLAEAHLKGIVRFVQTWEEDKGKK